MRGLLRPWAGAAVAALAGCGMGGPEGRETSANEVAQQLAELRIEPGLWERSTQVVGVTAPGLPREVATRAARRRSSRRYCITPEQAARPNATFLATQRNSDCSYRDFTMEGGRISGTMTCTGGQVPGDIHTSMDGQYGPQSYDMRMRMTTQMPGGEEIVTEIRVRGRRVGECGPRGGTG